jgi:hypothetical protein
VASKTPKSEQREQLRQKGQFWTPDWVAEAMVAYALKNRAHELFDPSVGAGAFFKAARTIGAEVQFSGYELDVGALQQASGLGLTSVDLKEVVQGDFLGHPLHNKFSAIVANPPYVRHHRLESTLKERLNEWASSLLGHSLDARAGLHIYFLLRLLVLLEPGGHLAIIVPADVSEGVFARGLWAWIARSYRLEAAIVFEHQASPFEGVDTNPMVLLLKNAPPKESFFWVRCQQKHNRHLRRWIESDFSIEAEGCEVHQRSLSEALSTGLSRSISPSSDGLTLGDFARVMRGIATGANGFFLLDDQQVETLGLGREFLQPAIARVRDVDSDDLSPILFEKVRASGRPTWLFAPDGRPLEQFPKAVQSYLIQGQDLGLPERPLISTRRPWYRMESRAVPPLLFAYLGRRNQRFILNSAKVLPLTGFLAIYPKASSLDLTAHLWKALNHPETLANLALVSKSYGGGALKAEPRGLEKLSIPQSVLVEFSLATPKLAKQPKLLPL